MKETAMNTWQITQIFLSDTGVHEVHVNVNNLKLKCNCLGFAARNTCKHSNFVKERMNNNGGVYPVEISNKVSRAESVVAMEDPIAFRDMVLKYGKIEVL